MKRLAVFAHFDKKNVIDDYVLFYVQNLKKYCDKILFLSLSDLPYEEQNKLENVILVKHNEYDFGSYKKGFNYALKNGLLNDIDELLFVNDSVYCIESLDDIFAQNYNADFWGIVENKFGFKKYGKFCFSKKQPHIQSWFIAFRNNVFNSKVFCDFINSVKEEKSKNDVILNYEIKLTQTLVNSGFKYSTFIKKYENSSNPSIFYWKELLKYGSPFIKRSVLLGLNRDKTTIAGYEDEIKNKKVLRYIKNNVGEIKINTFTPLLVKNCMFDFLRICPDVFRRILTKILRTFFIFLFD
ncbi:hypothetical protein IJ818_04985 [bacterium]|nr:hypothetical protein [bacterium]